MEYQWTLDFLLACLVRMRRQAERWGAELYQEDVEYIDVKNTPFTVKSSDRKVIGLPFVYAEVIEMNM